MLGRRARRKPAKADRHTDPTPRRVQTLVAQLSGLRPLYVGRATPGSEPAAKVVSRVDSVLSNTTELFRRLSAKADRAQRERAEEEYVDKLGKLVSALDSDYPLDVLTSPQLWDDPDRRIRDVHNAVEAVDAQLLENVKQVNAHRGLVFQVAIDGLIGPRKEKENWQRDFDDLAGTTG